MVLVVDLRIDDMIDYLLAGLMNVLSYMNLRDTFSVLNDKAARISKPIILRGLLIIPILTAFIKLNMYFIYFYHFFFNF